MKAMHGVQSVLSTARRSFCLLAVMVAVHQASIASDLLKGPGSPNRDEAPPEHAIEQADEEEKELYEAVRARIMKLGPQTVAGMAAKPGFGERVGSQLAPVLETCVWGYRTSGDAAWLAKFAELMRALEERLVEDPDGGRGWYSAADPRTFGQVWPPRWPDPEVLTAWQQSEARVAGACAEFARTVRGRMALVDRFGGPASGWLRLCEKELLPKWDRRCYVELDEDRAVYTWPARAFRRGGDEWIAYPGCPREGENITLPHPAVSEIALGYLKLWRATGESAYRTRAAKLMRWQKSCLRFYHARPGRAGRPPKGRADKSVYWWNLFDPAGDWDFRPEGGLVFGMYISTDPHSHARDVEAFVEAYHCGVVIDRQDIDRLVATQRKKMLAGDPERPRWKNQRGEGRGTLWPALAEFSEELDEVLRANHDPRSNAFGSPLRFLQERPRWRGGERRKLGDARVISWGKTHARFAGAMRELIRKHPPPPPRGRRR